MKLAIQIFVHVRVFSMTDVVGFVNYCGFVHWVWADGYWEKEFQLTLQSSPSGEDR